MPPETFYVAAEEALPKDLLQCGSFDYLRGVALLALASIQDTKMEAMHKFIGLYFAVLSIFQWHDEGRWPDAMTSGEVEERRRLVRPCLCCCRVSELTGSEQYWSMYTLDVYTSIVWDSCIHFQEGHSKVAYPSTSSCANECDWLVGWNFTTDLYRILEHDVSKLRSLSSRFNLGGAGKTSAPSGSPSQTLIAELYAALPPIFKHFQPATGDPAKNIYGFQAANIQATMALQKMVHLSLEVDNGHEKKCSVVSDVLSTFHQVPKPYLRAISTPFVYHIGIIGVILGSLMEGLLSESSCRRVRDLLLSMAALLESLEAFLHRGAGTGQRLRDLVARIEEYMHSRTNNALAEAQQASVGTASNSLHEATTQWDGTAGLQDFSPQFQLPDEVLQDWMWPFAMSNEYTFF